MTDFDDLGGTDMDGNIFPTNNESFICPSPKCKLIFLTQTALSEHLLNTGHEHHVKRQPVPTGHHIEPSFMAKRAYDDDKQAQNKWGGEKFE